MKLKRRDQKPVQNELKPTRSLLNPNFDGYKLSLDPLPSYSIPVEHGVQKLAPAENQYSLQHIRLFAIHNQLIEDPWNPNCVYFVDGKNRLCGTTFDTQRVKLNHPTAVWNIPDPDIPTQIQYYPTIRFPDKCFAVVSDGYGSLHILKTLNRSDQDDEWKVCFSCPSLLRDENDQNSSFVILDAVSYNEKDLFCIDVLLIHVEEKNDKIKQLEYFEGRVISEHGSKNPGFINVLDWITLANDSVDTDNWTLKRHRKIIGRGIVEYGALEPKGTGIILASNKMFYMSFDSEKPIDYSEELAEDDEKTNQFKYFWMQNQKEITVWFKLPIESEDHEVSLKIENSFLAIKYKEHDVFGGKFTVAVKDSDFSWNFSNIIQDAVEMHFEDSEIKPEFENFRSMKLTVSKENMDEQAMSHLFAEDDKGKQIFDQSVLVEMHKRLEHLCSDKWGDEPKKSAVFDNQQLEECDDGLGESMFLIRLDRDLQIATSQSNIGSHQILFNFKSDPFKLPLFCVRYDVDGIIWQPDLKEEQKQGEDEPLVIKEVLNCTHVGTFSAFGYVQASKQQRKFTICPPDMSYAAVCDTKKHIYLYRQPSAIDTDLRNRKTGRKVGQVSKQQVISIDPPLEIVGACATNSWIFILTSENMHAIRVSDPV